jgi:exopolysaccharide production protein ExoQ
MPFIALTVSLIFSTFLIVRDYMRRRRTVSMAVWIPTILVMVLGSRPVSLWLSGKDVQLGRLMANDQANSTIDQIFFLVIFGAALGIISWRGFKWKMLFMANTAIMFFYLYFAVSVCWSSDPIGSIKRIVKDFALLFVVGVVLSEKDPLQAMRAVFVRSASLLLPLSMVFIKYYPDYGRAYDVAGGVMLTGVTTQKNSLGEIVLLFTIFLVWDVVEMRPPGTKFRLKQIPWDVIILLLLGAWLLHLSQSKTALLCTVISVFLILRSEKLVSRAFNWIVLAGALTLPFIVFFSQRFSYLIAPLVEALGRNMTFTGRTDIWTHITLQTVNPLIGYGYWNFWGGPGGYAVNMAMMEIIPNAHNGYVDLYLDGGIIGLIILFCMLLSCGRRLMKYLSAGGDLNRYYRVQFAVLIAAIIYNLGESTFARIGPIWFTTLLMIVDYPPLKVAVKNAREAMQRRRHPVSTFRPPALANGADVPFRSHF